jgi:hypothetical protein
MLYPGFLHCADGSVDCYAMSSHGASLNNRHQAKTDTMIDVRN